MAINRNLSNAETSDLIFNVARTQRHDNVQEAIHDLCELNGNWWMFLHTDDFENWCSYSHRDLITRLDFFEHIKFLAAEGKIASASPEGAGMAGKFELEPLTLEEQMDRIDRAGQVARDFIMQI